MSIHTNIQFHDKIGKFPYIFVFLSEEFRRGSKTSSNISHDK